MFTTARVVHAARSAAAHSPRPAAAFTRSISVASAIENGEKILQMLSKHVNPKIVGRTAAVTAVIAMPVIVLWGLYSVIEEEDRTASDFLSDWGPLKQKTTPLKGKGENALEEGYYNIRRSQLYRELITSCIATRRDYFDFSELFKLVYGFPERYLTDRYCTPIINVYGRRGSGKTTLVTPALKDYAERYKTSFIWRVPVKSKQGLVQELIKLARFLDVKELPVWSEKGLFESDADYNTRVKEVCVHLVEAISPKLREMRKKGEWILVFDLEVEDTKWLLNLISPSHLTYDPWDKGQVGIGKIVILSRQSKPYEHRDYYIAANISLVDGFSEEEVNELLAQELKAFPSEADRAALRKIAALVGYNPLAIHTVILYAKAEKAKNSDFSLGNYYELLQKRYLKSEFHDTTLNDARKAETPRYPFTDRDVIKFSYEKSLLAAQHALYLCSLFKLAQPIKLLSTLEIKLGLKILTPGTTVLSYGLASIKERRIELDPLVREICLAEHKWPSPVEKRQYLSAYLTAALEEAGEAASASKLSVFKQKEDYAQGLEQILSELKDDTTFQSEYKVQIAMAKLFIAEVKVKQRKNEEALRLLDEAMPVLCIESVGFQIRIHLEKVKALIQEQKPHVHLGAINMELAAAKQLLEEHLKIEPENKEIQRLLGHYYHLEANAYGLQVKVPESLASRRLAYSAYIGAGDKPGLAETEYWLGFSARTQGDLVLAKKYYESALDSATALYENYHPARLRVLADLAGVERQLGNLPLALNLAKEALVKNEETSGNLGQPTTMVRIEYLKILDDLAAPIAECKDQIDLLVSGFERNGAQISGLSKARGYMLIGKIYLQQGEFEMANVCFRRGQDLRKDLPSDHLERADTAYYFALLAYHQGKFAEAIEHCKTADTVYSLPKYSSLRQKAEYFNFLELKAEILSKQGKVTESIACLEELAAGLQKLPELEPKLREIVQRLAKLYPDGTSTSALRTTVVAPLFEKMQAEAREIKLAGVVEKIYERGQ